MKYLLILIISVILASTAFAQLRGNGNIVSIEWELITFTEIDNGLSSNISVRFGESNTLTVRTDENLLNSIKIEVIDGALEIDQLEWISASQKIEIDITTQSLIEFRNSAHGMYSIVGIDEQEFVLNANVGDFILSGNTGFLGISTAVGKVDASDLIAKSADVNIESFGTVTLNVQDQLDTQISNNGKVVFVNEPAILSNRNEEGAQVVSREEDQKPRPEVAYIDVKLKNNSLRRVKVIFSGPEDARFGYGAPIGRLQTKNERFPVGTKVYLDNNSPEKVLLIEISADDEGKTLKLFQ